MIPTPRLFVAEVLKLRRTSIPWLALLAPYIVVLVFSVVAAYEGERLFRLSGVSPWSWLGETCWTVWTLVVWPLFIGLNAALLAGLEHRNEGLKHLLALPVSRGGVFTVKHLVGWLITAVSFTSLAVGLVAAGLVLRWLRPGLGFDAPVPVAALATAAVLGSLAAGFAVALVSWLSYLTSDLAPPIIFGGLAMVSLVALVGFAPELAVYHPLAYPNLAVASFPTLEAAALWGLLGGGAGLLFGALSAVSLGRREVG